MSASKECFMERVIKMTIARINFRNPKNINGWEAHAINPIQVFYTNKDFCGKILLVKRSINELELFFINSAEDIIDSFFVNNYHDEIAETLDSILENGFEKTFKSVV